MTIPTTHSQTPRWWLVSVLAAVAAMALATGALYLPSGWWWVLVLGLVVFGITFWLQPSSWYRRRAAIAMSIAAITTIAPGFEAILRFGPDTMGSLIVKTGWPAIVMPWLVAAWFGWLDFLSRKPVSQVTGASMQTSIRAIFAKTVHVTIHQGTTQLEPNNEYPDNADPPEIPRVAATLAPAFSKGGNHPIAQSRLPHSAEQLIGRTQELRKLTQALNNDKTHIVSIITWGGLSPGAGWGRPHWCMNGCRAWWCRNGRRSSVISTGRFTARGCASKARLRRIISLLRRCGILAMPIRRPVRRMIVVSGWLGW